MKYSNIIKGKFISRPNRFIAYVDIDGKKTLCHVKNTGRCKELLVPDVDVFLQYFPNTSRKTEYDLIAVQKGKILINMDSQAPNKVFYEWAPMYFKDIKLLKPEYKYLNSRFDCYIETSKDKILVEVKGVTLENDGVVKFPDAPTERGLKHILELIEATKHGYEAYIVFVIQMTDVIYMTANRDTHPEFADALLLAQENGVKILCLDCLVSENELKINKQIKYKPSY